MNWPDLLSHRFPPSNHSQPHVHMCRNSCDLNTFQQQVQSILHCKQSFSQSSGYQQMQQKTQQIHQPTDALSTWSGA